MCEYAVMILASNGKQHHQAIVINLNYSRGNSNEVAEFTRTNCTICHANTQRFLDFLGDGERDLR